MEQLSKKEIAKKELRDYLNSLPKEQLLFMEDYHRRMFHYYKNISEDKGGTYTPYRYATLTFSYSHIEAIELIKSAMIEQFEKRS